VPERPAPAPPANLPPAILLGGEIIAVSAARSLARTGVEVIALGESREPVQWSRHCSRFVDMGTGRPARERYLKWLVTEGPRRGVLIACVDDALELLVRDEATLRGHGYQLVECDTAVLAALLDKHRTYELCREVGVPAPRTALVRDAEAAERAAREFPYPCALKPLHSHRFAEHFGILAKVVRIESREELVSAFDRMLSLGLEMLVTEIIPGRDDRFRSYYTYMDADGRPLFHLTKGKLRQWPIEFGLATYQLTVWEPEVARLGLRFFEAARLRGLGNIEFKHDPRDGAWKLIECNARLTAATEQVRIAGIDLPLLVYNRVTGRPDPPLDGFRDGVYFWHPVEDVKAMLAYRRAGQLSVRGWARSLMHRQHFAMASLDDPMPTVRTIGRRARNLARNVAARS
jgi:predicted ATP-grasp superfamily ATP-dependent carboligase